MMEYILARVSIKSVRISISLTNAQERKYRWLHCTANCAVVLTLRRYLYSIHSVSTIVQNISTTADTSRQNSCSIGVFNLPRLRVLDFHSVINSLEVEHLIGSVNIC